MNGTRISIRTVVGALLLAGAVAGLTLPAVVPGSQAAGARGDRAASGGGAKAPVADSALGLSRSSVFSVPEPRGFVPESSAPGEHPRRERAFATAPPQIPHGIADFVPITREANACITCHSREGVEEGSGAVRIPDSHYTDLRNDPEEVEDSVVGARYVCTSCHAPGSDARPLVGNRSRQ